MSYAAAPATKMLATHCAICARSLLDAKSVEIGIGPVCRDKHGYGEVEGLTEEVRVEANKLIHKIACDQDGPAVIPAITRLLELKLIGVVTAIIDRVATVKIAMTSAGDYVVKAPYNETAVALLRSVPGRRWDKEKKLNTFPAASKRELFTALIQAYPDALACGPRGMFMLRKLPEQGMKINRTPMAAA